MPIWHGNCRHAGNVPDFRDPMATPSKGIGSINTMTQQPSTSGWDADFGNQCRVGCGACCIAISISTTIPGMSGPKPAGVRCIQLTSDNRCLLYGKPERPDVCREFQPSAEICGRTNTEAMHNLIELEALTSS